MPSKHTPKCCEEGCTVSYAKGGNLVVGELVVKGIKIHIPHDISSHQDTASGWQSRLQNVWPLCHHQSCSGKKLTLLLRTLNRMGESDAMICWAPHSSVTCAYFSSKLWNVSTPLLTYCSFFRDQVMRMDTKKESVTNNMKLIIVLLLKEVFQFSLNFFMNHEVLCLINKSFKNAFVN